MCVRLCVCVCRILMRTYYGYILCVHGHVVRSCVYPAFVRMYMIYIVCRYTCMSSFRACVCPTFIRMSCVHAYVISLCVCMYVVRSCIMYVRVTAWHHKMTTVLFKCPKTNELRLQYGLNNSNNNLNYLFNTANQGQNMKLIHNTLKLYDH